MSPSEPELRAALRAGEGDPLHPDRLIARAQAMQHERHVRRMRFTAVAAGVIVAGAIGTGVVAIGRNQTTSNGASNAGGGAVNSLASRSSADSDAGHKHAPPAAAGASAAAACPAAAPDLALPGGGGTAQFGATGSLFSGSVQSVEVCAYDSARKAITSHGAPLAAHLTGQEATALAASLDSAAKVPVRAPCPMYRGADEKLLVIIGYDAAGRPMKPIVATVLQNPCNLPVTNGTAIRYDWSPPPALLNSVLGQLQPTTAPTR
jgi:hypothetical protein